MSDALVAAICAGDTDAFARWMRGAERPIRQSLRRFAASVDAEAVLQETLLRVWQVAPRFESDGRPNGLLRLGIRVAHNLAISEIRKTGRSRGADESELERHLNDALHFSTSTSPDPHLRKAIEECRDELPDKPRVALTARLGSQGGEHDATIAANVGMKKNTFLQNITRARKFMEHCLEGKGVDLVQELS